MLLIAVKILISSFVISIEVSFEKSHLSGINFRSSEKKNILSTLREKNVYPRSKDLLIFACVRPQVANTELVRWPGPVIGGGLRDTGPIVTARPALELVTWPLRVGTRGGRRRHAQARARHDRG